jgi:micrococcal nuclease
MYEYHAQLVRVVDGDTMHVRVDMGADLHLDMVLRLFGVNAPEMSTSTGKPAKAWVQRWFDEHTLEGLFLLRTIKDKREKYGRYLASVWSLDGTAELNADMVAANQAVVYLP